MLPILMQERQELNKESTGLGKIFRYFQTHAESQHGYGLGNFGELVKAKEYIATTRKLDFSGKIIMGY